MQLYLTGELGQAGNGATDFRTLSGPFHVTYSGSFGGATVVLQVSIDQGLTWITVPNTSATSNTTFAIELGHGHLVRGLVSGGTGSVIQILVGTIPQPVTNVA